MAKGPYRAIVYVDGFNFYYGAVRGTPWKWLDPGAPFRKGPGRQNTLVKIKYYHLVAALQPPALKALFSPYVYKPASSLKTAHGPGLHLPVAATFSSPNSSGGIGSVNFHHTVIGFSPSQRSCCNRPQ